MARFKGEMAELARGKRVWITGDRLWCRNPDDADAGYGHWYIHRKDLYRAFRAQSSTTIVTHRVGGDGSRYALRVNIPVHLSVRIIGCCQFKPADWRRIRRWAERPVRKAKRDREALRCQQGELPNRMDSRCLV